MNGLDSERSPTGREAAWANSVRPRRGHLLALLVLVASVITVLALWRSAYVREVRAAEARFVASTEDVLHRIEQRLGNYELIAGGGLSLFSSVNRPTPQQWYGYAAGMDLPQRVPSVVGLGFAGYLRRPLEELAREWEEAGYGHLDLRPLGDRPTYGPVMYLEPHTPENLAAIGFDLYSEPVRRQAMDRALDTGEPTLTGPVQLFMEDDDASGGLVLFVPVFREGRPLTPARRREVMLGWVFLPIRTGALVDEALNERRSEPDFVISDVTGGEPVALYASRGEVGNPAFTHSLRLDVSGRVWQLDFRSLPLHAAAPRLHGLQQTLALGLFASLLMYLVAWTLARTQSRAHALATRMTEDYRRSEQRFRAAMQYSAIGKVLLDSHGDVAEANPAFSRIVGLSQQSLVGVHFDDLFEDSSGPVTARHVGDAPEVSRQTRVLHRKGGHARHVQLTYAPVPGSVGEDIVGLIQAEDVTEQLRAQARVHALNRTLEQRVAQRTRELSEANQELETFAYSVSHDLRAPLRAIDGFSKVLMERYAGQLDESGQGYLQRVRGAANRMGELIDAMLLMSRLGRSPLKRERIDLSAMAAEVAEELRAADPEHPMRITIQPGLEAEGDATLLRNLLHNLLGNAWKFTRGHPDPRVEFGAEDGTFHVRDNGAGFDQEYVGKLFRPFQRLHDQKTFTGHGIGLASVKRIVQRHGGTISAEGVVGQGATFRFTLPEGEEEPAAE
ncbi:CHASE domain-containing protein [Lysobacter sp. GX 14042]|uniref:CHASE domain-containing protein n=1 Tax=Lysobacter sp. GX 14042 TaxID=2907155 RepID=UPI001F1BDEBF|nr:CHASE domain-containing protein [Lysobacter sp. GX 14042]MCE7031304.1 CHASE domain-containing protein [Lysobacter sp. GX 14042]